MAIYHEMPQPERWAVVQAAIPSLISTEALEIHPGSNLFHAKAQGKYEGAKINEIRARPW
jgi:hypothetical protein